MYVDYRPPTRSVLGNFQHYLDYIAKGHAQLKEEKKRVMKRLTVIRRVGVNQAPPPRNRRES
jgi:vacuolar-type H+-ATPase subunit D/Vma8